MDDLFITHESCTGFVLVRLRGALTMLSAPVLTVYLASINALQASCDVILDVGELELVDSAGLGALVAAHRHCAADGGYLRLVNVRAGLLESLYMTRLETLFPRYRSLEDAVADHPVQLSRTAACFG